MYRIIVVGFILFGSIICCCGSAANPQLLHNREDLAQSTSSEPEKLIDKKTPTAVKEKTKIIELQNEEDNNSIESLESSAIVESSHIPGLNPEEILEKFNEKYHLVCLGWSYGWNVWSDECITMGGVNPSYGFTVYSRNERTVDYIEASVIQLENPQVDIITLFFKDVLELPYAGSSPEMVLDWIKSEIPNMSGIPGDIRNLTYSGINYRLYGNVEGMWLELGEIEQYIEMP